jgi:putative ABC transport system permease protein
MPVFSLAWRLFRHEARRGELSIILAAIVLSVSAVLSLSLFSERLQQAITSKTAEFIAADRVLSADKPVDPEWIEYADAIGLNTANQVYTRSMAFSDENMLLVDFGAASAGYPLKGEIKVADQPFARPYITDELPQRGQVWAESRVFQVLGVELGDVIGLGEAEFVVSRVLSEVPDAGFSVFGGDPKVLINLTDLAATEITGPGSRANYTYYFTGDNALLDEYYDWLKLKLDREIHQWQSVADDDSWLGQAVARAEQYFLLASLLAIVLAAVSIAVAAQRYSQRHYDPVAIFKTLGASRKQIQQVYLLQIGFISLLGIVVGTAAGVFIQHIVVWFLADRIEVDLAMWHWRPLVIAIFTGLICAVLFSLYPLLKLFSVPPLRVLRRDLGASVSSRLLQFVIAGGAVLLLMWSYSQNWKISLILFGTGVILVIGLMLLTVGLIRLGRKLGQGRTGAWQLAWARIHRRAMDNSVQLISFSLTLMLLLLVLALRNDMVKQWQNQLPQGTPNYFLANITQTQLPALTQHFAEQGVAVEDYFPVVRGRFVAVNGEMVNTKVTKEEDDGREDDEVSPSGLGREANLTWGTELQNENRVIEGEWLTERDPEQGYGVSVEEGVAKRLGIKMGDTLTFNIASITTEVEVTSIREVNWQTMQPNFFFIFHPDAVAGFVPTYLTSFYLPRDSKAQLTELMRPFASVTLFDVDARIEQLREIVQQVSMAVEFILVLVLVAGSLVLIAQVQASMQERQQELAILRTLGAKGRMIRASVVYEFVIIGVLSGAMAALANEIGLYLLQSQVFQMESQIHWQYWLISPLAGAILVGVLGSLGCRQLLSLNTHDLLRQTG